MKDAGKFILNNCAIEVMGEKYSFGLNQILDLHYMEDITKSNIVVAVTLTDSESNIISDIYGMEPILFSWSTGETEINLPMVVYDIQDRQIIGKATKGTLYCISSDAVNNAGLKISRRFGSGGGEHIHTMVTKLINETLASRKGILYDRSQTKFSFISPYWDPYTIISWLSWRAIPEPAKGGTTTSAGYLFWETPTHYHFKAMDNLVDQPSKKTIRVGYSPDEYDKDFIDIDALTFLGSSDVFRGLNLGSYRSTNMTLDLKDFSYREIPYDVNKYYNGMKKLNPGATLPSFYDIFKDNVEEGTALGPTRIMSRIIDTAMYTEGKHTQDLTKQLSQSQIRNQFFFNQSASFTYKGEQDLQCGDVVNVQTWSGKQLTPDITQSGRYIVGKIYRSYSTDSEKLLTRVTIYRDSQGAEEDE